MSDLVSSPIAPWLGLGVAIAILLTIDLFVIRGRGGVMSARSAAIASAAWVAIALAFAGVLLVAGERSDAGAYLAGYLVEKSLSLDNVFVYLLVLTAFAVPTEQRHRLLTFGIVGALLLRGVFIVAGATLLERFGWVSFVFAALLLWTAWRLFVNRHDHGSEDRLVARLNARLPSAFAGALVAIVIVDVLFAIDSIPAILAITDDAFIVFAANAFALLGLRPLFFLVADLVERLYYLKTALAALLAFIGLKMTFGELFGKVGPEVSLPAIALILATGVVASLLRERRQQASVPEIT